MKMSIALSAAILATVIVADSIPAHHSGSLYETTPVLISGTVVGFEPRNPHTITTIEAVGENGLLSRWAIEGPAQFQLNAMPRSLNIPEVGQAIAVCGFPYKSMEELTRLFPDADFSGRESITNRDDSSTLYVAGHVMTMPGGVRQLWEPHGLISECIQHSDDSRQSWLDFINSSPRVQRAWCEQQRYTAVQSNPSLQELVDEIDSQIENPCG